MIKKLARTPQAQAEQDERDALLLAWQRVIADDIIREGFISIRTNLIHYGAALRQLDEQHANARKTRSKR